MAKRCMGGYTTTREVYKTVKKYDHQQFDAFCTRVYTNGFNDGKKSVTEKPVRTITDEQLMEVIKSIRHLLLEEKSTIRFIFQFTQTARSTVNHIAFHTRNLGQTLRMMKQQRFASLKVKAGT